MTRVLMYLVKFGPRQTLTGNVVIAIERYVLCVPYMLFYISFSNFRFLFFLYICLASSLLLLLLK